MLQSGNTAFETLQSSHGFTPGHRVIPPGVPWHQAYLTFVASGQISCKEDGGHHRPCAAANAAKAVTEALWDISTQGASPTEPVGGGA